MRLPDKKLMQLDALGLIPGPGEETADFLQRTETCLQLKETLEAPFGAPLCLPQNFSDKSFEETERLFGIRPAWVPVFFSNHELPPWQGGVTWIFQKEENSPKSAFIQMRKVFFDRRRYLFYDRAEIAAHEYAHIGRMAFDEPDFEEILAYRTAKNGFRRYFGPLAASASSARWFMIVIITLLMLDIAAVAMGNPSLYLSLFWLKSIPLLMILYAVCKLVKRQMIFNRCLKQLEGVSSGNGLKIAYRLTDEEIYLFAKSSLEGIHAYASRQSSLRWQLIKTMMAQA